MKKLLKSAARTTRSSKWSAIRLTLVFCFFGNVISSQPAFAEVWAYSYQASYSPLSLKADQLDRPYLYVASNEGGLIILSTDGELVRQLTTAELGLQVMNVTQEDSILYLALGSHFSDGPAGVGAIDISDPANPVILDVWIYETPEPTNGMGILVLQNGYLYAGAMGAGLLILDPSDPGNLQLVSALSLDINYPHPNPANPDLYNARGMEVVGDLVYLTFDAGGLRVIDVSDPENPVQIGAYANPITFEPFNRPRAYNNVEVIDSVAYVTVDYCGLEALDISDPTDIQLLDHYNPVGCPDGSWYNAELHTNEIVSRPSCNQLFVTAGRSELLAFDISDPSQLLVNGSFGDIQDTMATWGLDLRDDRIYLSYLLIPVYIPFIHPFDAKWAGVKMLEVEQECVSNTSHPGTASEGVSIFPNPGTGRYTLEMKDAGRFQYLQILDAGGRLLRNEPVGNMESLDLELPPVSGLFYLRLTGEQQTLTRRIVQIR